MLKAIFDQLAGLLTHLGEKRIAILNLGGMEIRFDIMAILMSWVVIALLVILALFLRRGLRQPVTEKPSRTQAALVALIDLLKGQLAGNFASERLATMMFPFVSTIFLYVLLQLAWRAALYAVADAERQHHPGPCASRCGCVPCVGSAVQWRAQVAQEFH